ncbi:MAG: phosphotransferase [Methanomicrobiales archaeon]|nr:phosphotransferase [Methanomicrobiales archaeon]
MAEVDKNNPLFADVGNDEEFVKRYGTCIGTGMSAVIYARDEVAAKVYREGQKAFQAFKEAFTLSVVGELGIPAPRVYGVETFQGRTAVLMDQVRGVSLSDIMGESVDKVPECLDKAVELQIAMHNATFSDFVPQKNMVRGMILDGPGLTDGERKMLLKKLDSLPEGSSICHGDFHCGNILFNGTSYQIIDWAEVSSGCPAADACRSYLDYWFMSEELAEMYLERYCRLSGKPREEVLAWLPVMAGSLYGYLSEEAKKMAALFFRK